MNLGFMMFADIWSRIVAVSYHDPRVLKDGVGTEEIVRVFD